MRLIDLQPEWVYDFNAVSHGMRRGTDTHSHIVGGRGGDDEILSPLTIERAQGILFLCPVCFKKNGGSIGTESILCWFKDRGVPDDAEPGPGRWSVSGTGFDDLTLSPSVNVNNEHWHGWIQNGEVT